MLHHPLLIRAVPGRLEKSTQDRVGQRADETTCGPDHSHEEPAWAPSSPGGVIWHSKDKTEDAVTGPNQCTSSDRCQGARQGHTTVRTPGHDPSKAGRDQARG